MFEFFASVAGFIETGVNFIVNMFSLMIEILVSMVRGVTWLFLCVSYLPPFLVGFVVVPVSLAIIFQVLNKGS